MGGLVLGPGSWAVTCSALSRENRPNLKGGLCSGWFLNSRYIPDCGPPTPLPSLHFLAEARIGIHYLTSKEFIRAVCEDPCPLCPQPGGRVVQFTEKSRLQGPGSEPEGLAYTGSFAAPRPPQSPIMIPPGGGALSSSALTRWGADFHLSI